MRKIFRAERFTNSIRCKKLNADFALGCDIVHHTRASGRQFRHWQGAPSRAGVMLHEYQQASAAQVRERESEGKPGPQRWTDFLGEGSLLLLHPDVIGGIDAYRLGMGALLKEADIPETSRRFKDPPSFPSLTASVRDAIEEVEQVNIRQWAHDLNNAVNPLITLASMMGKYLPGEREISNILDVFSHMIQNLQLGHLKSFFDRFNNEVAPPLTDFTRGLEAWADDNPDFKKSANIFQASLENLKGLMRRFQGSIEGHPLLDGETSLRDMEEDLKAFVSSLSPEVDFEFVARDTCEVEVNPHDVSRMIHNLIVNAHEACTGREKTGRPPQIFVSMKTLRDGEWENYKKVQHPYVNSFFILPETKGPLVCVTVSDTGCGIDTESLPQIFHQGFSTKKESRYRGWGLSSVRDQLLKYEGGIMVISCPGIGSTFHLFLPAAEKPEPENS